MKTLATILSEILLKRNYATALNRGASRCPNSITNASLHLKSQYWSNFLKQFYDKKYIINIDEAGFSQSVKQNYSWLPRGRSSAIINDVFRGRTNLILGVSQTGDYLGLLSNKSITASDYWLYLIIHSKVLKSWGIENKKEVTLVQD